ncbi:MAG: hypothetical protein SVM79_00080 [Chloroflexota bacterium]|nr:hypothetical protein [Chloroflexota bacterium]
MSQPAYTEEQQRIARRLIAASDPKELLSVIEGGAGQYQKYQEDPVAFGEDHLGISYTPDIQRMLQSVVEHQITVVRSATGTGKSHGAAGAAIWFYKAFPNSRVYTIANPFENQKILWSELSTMAGTPKLFDSDRQINYQIERSAKDFITALTVPTAGTEQVREGKFSGKHHQHMLFIVDEGDTVPDFVYRGVEGCMSGGTIVRLLILFNPRHESGRPYRIERDAEANIVELSAFNHPNVRTGENLIPGAVDRDTTVRRINRWTRPAMADDDVTERNSFVVPDFLVGATAVKRGGGTYPPLSAGTRIITNPAFSYMVLGRYPAESENQLISIDWINQARARWDEFTAKWGQKPPVSATGHGVLGLDSAEFGVDSNVGIVRCGGFVHIPETWNGVDMVATGDKGAEIYQAYQCQAAYPDGIGVGAGVAPHMRRLGCTAVSIKVSEAPSKTAEEGDFRKMRDQLWWSCREWLRTDPNAMLPPDERLLEELKTPTYRQVNGKIVVTEKDDLREMLRRSPDRADALCLTFADTERRRQSPSMRREIVIEDAEGWT